jgi:hypothetical protein
MKLRIIAWIACGVMVTFWKARSNWGSPFLFDESSHVPLRWWTENEKSRRKVGVARRKLGSWPKVQ